MQAGPDIWTLSGHGEAREPARFALATELGIAVVTDGFGSFSGGALAAQLASDLFPLYLKRRAAPQVPPWVGLAGVTARHVEAAAAAVSDQIQAASQLDEFYHGMGATLAALILLSDEILIAHVGDCFVLRVRGTEVERLTKPHVRLDTPRVLTRALGTPNAEIEVVAAAPADKDVFVLGSSAAAPTLELLLRDLARHDFSGGIDHLCTAISLPDGAYVMVAVQKTASIGPLRRAEAWSGAAPKSPGSG